MRLLFAILLVVHLGARAQQAEPILFAEKSFDFGEISEAGGTADHEFIFTNNTGRVISVLSVQASCGCTTPGWSKEPIQPGKTGFVKASFNPVGRPGYFNKSLSVRTDYDGSTISLQIKGQVAQKTAADASPAFPVENGNLRFKFNSFPLGKIFINRPATAKEFKVYNSASYTINFTGKVAGPRYIKVEAPKSLLPKQEGTIKLTYDAKMKNQYGFVSDNVEIETTDSLQALKSFSVYATIEELFPSLSAAEMKASPVLTADLTSIELGKIHQGNSVVREVILKNTGSKELLIRALQGNCTCLMGNVEGMKISPGGEAKLVLTLNTQGRMGLQQKAMTIYSNDPRNPVQRITLSGYVEQ